MKLTLSVAVLLSTSSACQWSHKKGYHHGFSDHVKRVLGVAPKHESCSVDEAKIMDMWTYHRLHHKTLHNSFAQGWYQTHSEEPFGEECFGSWMDDYKPQFEEFFEKAHAGDIWGISHQEIKDLANSGLDMFFKNLDACQYYRLPYDYYHWCMTNKEDCLRAPNWANDAMLEAVPFASNLMNIWTHLTTDDTCVGDEEYLENVGSYTKSMGLVARDWFHFKGKWHPDEEVEKLSLKEMGHNLHEANQSMPHGECPVLKAIKEFTGIDVHYFLHHKSAWWKSHHEEAKQVPHMNPFSLLMPGIQMPQGMPSFGSLF